MRKVDWQKCLEQEILKASTYPFAWGMHDCALFVCNCILAITGDDPAAAFRGKYDSEETAQAALFDFAGGGLQETAEKICQDLHYHETPVAYISRGDVVLVDLPTGITLGIVSLNGREALIAAPQGLQNIPLRLAVKAWRVE